jgi:hypothetical protein
MLIPLCLNIENYTKILLKVKYKLGFISIEYAIFLYNLADKFNSKKKYQIVEVLLSELMDVYLLAIQKNTPKMDIDERNVFFSKLHFVQPYIYSFLSQSCIHSSEFIKRCFEFRLMVKWTMVETKDQLMKRKVSFEELRDLLKGDEMIVEIVHFREVISSVRGTFYCLFFVITSEAIDAPMMIVLKNGTEQYGLFHGDYMKALMKKSIDFLSHDRYWGHIEAIAPNIIKAFVSTDGIYRYINLNSLQTKRGKYLFDEKEIILCHDLRNLIYTRTQAQEYPQKAIFLGNPVFYNKEDEGRDKPLREFLPDISATENEVRRSADILDKAGWETQVFTGEDVTKEIFNSTSEIGLLHLATHGLFRGFPRKDSLAGDYMYASGLFLSHPYQYSEENKEFNVSDDGYLFGKDILTMDLNNAELVVLSACESGVAVQSNTGESYGFQRTFFHAGAKSIILSLWKVDDDLTLELMTTFYSNWVITGDKILSFRSAQQQIKAKHSHPFYWACFILVIG